MKIGQQSFMSLFNKTKCCRVCLSVCLVFLSSTIYYDAGCTKKSLDRLTVAVKVVKEINVKFLLYTHTHKQFSWFRCDNFILFLLFITLEISIHWWRKWLLLLIINWIFVHKSWCAWPFYCLLIQPKESGNEQHFQVDNNNITSERNFSMVPILNIKWYGGSLLGAIRNTTFTNERRLYDVCHLFITDELDWWVLTCHAINSRSSPPHLFIYVCKTRMCMGNCLNYRENVWIYVWLYTAKHLSWEPGQFDKKS